MPEIGQVQYSHLEVLRLMLKDQGITEGLWQLIVNFGFGAVNVPGQDPKALVPAVIGVVNHLGIQRVDQPIPGLTVDAATGESVGSLDELQKAELSRLVGVAAEPAGD